MIGTEAEGGAGMGVIMGTCDENGNGNVNGETGIIGKGNGRDGNLIWEWHQGRGRGRGGTGMGNGMGTGMEKGREQE